MSEGVYLSRGKSTDQIKAELAAKKKRDAKVLAVEIPFGVAREGMEQLRQRDDLLLDVVMSLSFLEESLRGETSPASCNQLSCLIGLINTAVGAVQEKSDPTVRKIEDLIRSRVSQATKMEEFQC